MTGIERKRQNTWVPWAILQAQSSASPWTPLWYSEATRGHEIYSSFEEISPVYKKDCCKRSKLALQAEENIKSRLPDKKGQENG